MSSAVDQIRSTDPLEARYTFTVDDESITLIVDDDLSVVDVTRNLSGGAD